MRNLRSLVMGGVVILALGGGFLLSTRHAGRVQFLEKEAQVQSARIAELSTAGQHAEEKAARLTRQLEAQTLELARLRAQITDAKKMPRGQAGSEQLKAAISGNGNTNVVSTEPIVANIPVANWQDVGGATAQNALQTFLWSLRTRNAERLVQFVDPADQQFLVKEGEGIAQELGKVTGYRLLEVTQISPQQQMLRLRLDEGNGETKTEEFHFVNRGGNWLFSDTAKLEHLKTVAAGKR